MDHHAIQNGQQSPRMPQQGARASAGTASQRRYDGMSLPRDTDLDKTDLTGAESWVELSSQPSSSSLSSIGDEIVTAGLQVGGQYGRRRRLLASARSLPQQRTAIQTGDISSQEEYEETESEDDHMMISSNEQMQSSPEVVDTPEQDSYDSDSDGDDATALGRVTDRPAFQPQPNAFSHPQRSNSTSTAIPPHPHNGFTRPSFSQRSQTTRASRGPNFMSPSTREDNDAALRASLTTLLSCAAAARGIPKTKEEMEQHRSTNTGVSPSNQPMDLRLVPESELGHGQPGSSRPGVTSPQKRAADTRPSSRNSASKAKRSVSAGRSPRTTKKKKAGTAEEALISPTMLTWVVSAGVVVLVSVVGFGAGYVIGREVGRQEALSAGVSTANETTSCGREVIRSSSGGLRRLKWSEVGRSIVASS